jgi:DNA repair photolyase
MVTREIYAKSILSKSGIGGIDYCINPYVGCANACSYCYASFMKKYTGHTEPWGAFVDVKMNAPDLLARQTRRPRAGRVVLSSVTDPYQPAEATYRVTRGCLEVLAGTALSVDVLTKSPLVVRDVDLFQKMDDVEVGITITTDNDSIRRIFEPKAPAIGKRIEALKTLHDNGIRTYAFIGPLLPMDPEALAAAVRPYADGILIDRMNYTSKTAAIYRSRKIEKWLDRDFTEEIIGRLRAALAEKEITLC